MTDKDRDITLDEPPPAARVDQTKAIGIAALCLLLAIPVTALGFLNEPDRIVFWLLVPPLVAGVVAIFPTWLLCGASAFYVLLPILAVPAYLLYFLPVFGAWMMTAIGLGLEQDLVLDYVGIWWAFLLVSSGLLLFSRATAQKMVAWVMPGAETGHLDPLASFLSVTMPWIGVLLHVVRAVRSDRRWRWLFGVSVAGIFIVFPVVWIILGGDTDTGVLIPASFLLFLTLSGIVARILEAVRGLEDLPFKPMLVGWIALAVNAAIGGTLQGFGLEMLFTPLTFLLSGLTVLPLLYAFKAAFSSESGRLTRLVWLLALLELPIAYYPFYTAANEAHFVYTAKARADELINNGAHEEAISILSDAMDKALAQGLPTEVAEIAVSLVPLHSNKGDNETARLIANKALNGLSDVPFGWYVRRCIGYRCSGKDPVPRQRQLVLDLRIMLVQTLMALGDEVEAAQVALDSWRKASEAKMWRHLALLAQVAADWLRSAARYMDAYWWLADARNRIVRGGGPTDEVERLNKAIADLRHAIGEDAFWAAVAECARNDPEWCTAP